MGETLKELEISEETEGKRKAQEVMERFEKKRTLSGSLGLGVTIIAIGASLYHLFYAYFHPFFALDHRAIHWGFMSSLIFLLYPLSKRISPRQRPSLFDVTFWVISAGICIWIFIYSHEIMNRAGKFLDVDVLTGTILILLILEAARRSTGWPVPLVAIAL